jgi:hypothetical protein
MTNLKDQTTEYIVTSASSVAGRSCLTHRDNPADKKLWGLYGFIWPAGEGRYGCCVTSRVVASQVVPNLELPKDADGEWVHYFGAKELPGMLRALRVSRTGPGQLESFLRYEAKSRGSVPKSTSATTRNCSTLIDEKAL